MTKRKDDEPMRTFVYARRIVAELKCNKQQRRTLEIALTAYENLCRAMASVGEACTITEAELPARMGVISQLVAQAHATEITAAMDIYNRIWEEE